MYLRTTGNAKRNWKLLELQSYRFSFLHMQNTVISNKLPTYLDLETHKKCQKHWEAIRITLSYMRSFSHIQH